MRKSMEDLRKVCNGLGRFRKCRIGVGYESGIIQSRLEMDDEKDGNSAILGKPGGKESPIATAAKGHYK